jgi:hypothetical protein
VAGAEVPETLEPDIPVLVPLPETAPRAGFVAVVGSDGELGFCARRAERSSICRRWRLGAELSSRLPSTVEFTTPGGVELPPFVISSCRGGKERTVFC